MTNQNNELVDTYVGAVAAQMSASGVDEAVVEEVISVQQALLSELAEDGVDLEAELGFLRTMRRRWHTKSQARRKKKTLILRRGGYFCGMVGIVSGTRKIPVCYNRTFWESGGP